MGNDGIGQIERIFQEDTQQLSHWQDMSNDNTTWSGRLETGVFRTQEAILKRHVVKGSRRGTSQDEKSVVNQLRRACWL